jgi:hypothetical protein
VVFLFEASWSLMQMLSRLGFKPGRIVETIVATYDADGNPNAAPMGILVEANDRLLIRPYLQTRTFRNLKQHKQCTVNLTSNPEIFFKSCFKDVVGGLPENFFIRARKVYAPRLRQAEGWLEVKADEEAEVEDRAIFKCFVKAVYLGRMKPKAYCRANFAAIESIIHVTRILTYLKLGEQNKCSKLLELVRHYRGVVERTAPNSEAFKVLENLYLILSRHGLKI